MNTQSIYKSSAGEQEIMSLYDTVLARWPVAYETLNLPTRHGRTFVIASGDQAAPPLILLHGAASNAVSWVADFPEYSAGFRVYAVDLPGEAGKSAPNRPSWQTLDFAEWLEDVLDGLGVARASLVGISQGGWTALRFATTKPERVERLVLLTPGGIKPLRTSFFVKAMLYAPFGRWGGHRINQLVIGKHELHPEAVKFMDAIMAHFKTRIEKEYLFSDEELTRLDMPILLLVGEEDAMLPAEGMVGRMQALLPQLEAKLIPGMGHALIGMSGEVLSWLRAHAPA